MKLVEVYTSIQGEGPHTGRPIQFVRFGGCNLRCPGWPCDSEFAINPIHRANWESCTPREVERKLEPWPEHICITGGEPLTQPSSDMQEFVYGLFDWKIDLFTNGTRSLPPWAFEKRTSVVLDWKLAGSGEIFEQGVQSMRTANIAQLTEKDAVKFVIKDEADFEEAQYWTLMFDTWGVKCPIWAGVVWGHMKDDYLVSRILGESLNWRLNVQMHNHIWPPQERGR